MDISRASYYKWKNRVKPAKEIQDEQIAAIISEYHITFDGIYGYRRMAMNINHFNNTNYSKKYIHRLMKTMSIKSRIRRKKSNRSKPKPDQVAENILKRDFTVNSPNEKWLTDVTEFKVQNVTKVYLSAIIDLFDKSVVAYKFSSRNDNNIVFDNFELAIKANPTAKPIFHSDRGFQYTGMVFKTKLDNQGMIQSMSRVGKCIDNGPMEGFWGTMKSEGYYDKSFADRDELIAAMNKYTQFYNNGRLQEKLKCLTPIEYRNQALYV